MSLIFQKNTKFWENKMQIVAVSNNFICAFQSKQAFYYNSPSCFLLCINMDCLLHMNFSQEIINLFCSEKLPVSVNEHMSQLNYRSQWSNILN